MIDDPLDEQALVRAAKGAPSDDLRAFEALVARNQGHVVANCRHLTGSPAEAEDLAQEVFVKAFFALKRFEERSSFRTWVRQIKVNHSLSHLTKRKKERAVDLDDPGVADDRALRVEAAAEEQLLADDERVRIQAVLDALGESLRVPLVLRDLDGLSYQEIAEQLGLGLSAVKMRIKRGREEFRRLYQAEAGPPG